MSAAPPLPCVYHGGGVFTARSTRMADEHYGPGEVVTLAPVEERSEVSHRHEFAWLKDAWATLPEGVAEEYPTSEHLRKTALIRTGWCTVQDYACGNRTEALRWAVNLRKELDEYTVVEVSNTVVRVFRARSQARGKMNKEDFQNSKQAVIDFVAGLLQVEPERVTA